MKKNLLLFTLLFLGFNGFAQDSTQVDVPMNLDNTSVTVKESVNRFTLNMGISIPTGDFGSSNVNNNKSQYAKRGITGNFEWMYCKTGNFGIVISGHYRQWDREINPYYQNPEQPRFLETGLMIGLAKTFPGEKLSVDLKWKLGLSYANLKNERGSKRDDIDDAYSGSLTFRIPVNAGIEPSMGLEFNTTKHNLYKGDHAQKYMNSFNINFGLAFIL